MAATVYNTSPATLEGLLGQHQGSDSGTLLGLLGRFVSKPLVCHQECQPLQGVLRSWRSAMAAAALTTQPGGLQSTTRTTLTWTTS